MESLLPKNLQDTSFLALEECAKEALAVDTKAFMTSVVDFLPDAILMELARQFHIIDEGWSDCKTRAERVALIKKSVTLHKRKGTKGCIEDFFEAMEAKCRFWRDYNGIPHHFMIDVDYIDKAVDVNEVVSEIKKNIDKYKQLRAKLDEINFSFGVQKSINTASALCAGEIITVRF